MTKVLAALALAAVTTACSPIIPTSPAPGPGGAYMALGTEPFWSLEITPATMRFDEANAPGHQIVVTTPAQRAASNGHRYPGGRITVDVTRSECSDGMSDRRYADTVMLSVDGRAFKGCGGAILPPTSLNGTSWQIVSIDGRDIARGGREAFLRFEDGMINGSAGCNGFSGRYTSTPARLTLGPIMATQMACPQPAMSQEGAVLTILEKPVGVRFTTDNRMILTGEGGRTIVLRQNI